MSRGRDGGRGETEEGPGMALRSCCDREKEDKEQVKEEEKDDGGEEVRGGGMACEGRTG